MHEYKARPEHRGLLVGLLGKPAPADPLGEAQVIADERTGPGLPADPAFVDPQDAQPLRAGVDGCRQARRACADDDNVVDALVNVTWSPGSLRDFGVGRNRSGSGHWEEP